MGQGRPLAGADLQSETKAVRRGGKGARRQAEGNAGQRAKHTRGAGAVPAASSEWELGHGDPRGM